MVPAAMPIWQLDRLASQRESEQLVPKADPKDRHRPVRELPDRLDRVADRRRVARTVRQKNATRLQPPTLRPVRRGGHHSHTTSLLYEQPQDVALKPSGVFLSNG